jgi:hypothetical protein
MPFRYNKLKLGRYPLKTLDWLWNLCELRGIEFRYEPDMLTEYMAIGTADSEIELLKIINWLWSHCDKLEFKYDENLFGNMSSDAFLDVLNWFWDRRDHIEFKYTKEAIHSACVFKSFKILDFWFNRRYELELKYDEHSITDSCIEIWDWWYDRRDELELRYTSGLISSSIMYQQSFLFLPNESMLITYIKDYVGDFSVTTKRWWHWQENHNCNMKIAKIKWWYDKRNELEFRYNPYLLKNISNHASCNEIFDWWLINMPDCPLKLDVDTIKYMGSTGENPYIDYRLKWCIDNIDKLNVEVVNLLHEWLQEELCEELSE